jgi:putative phage-type endonuclease
MDAANPHQDYDTGLGCVTASRMSDLIPMKSGGYGTGRENYLADIIVERITGKPINSYVSFAMQQGIEREAEARALYAYKLDQDVSDPEFIHHPKIKWFGATPDGKIGGTEGLIEIKCPERAQHRRTVEVNEIQDRYQWQMQAQLACTGRQWVDFVSYNPDFPVEARLWVIHVPRDADKIAKLEAETTKFLREVEKHMPFWMALCPSSLLLDSASLSAQALASSPVPS